MKHWTSPMSICAMILTLFCCGQESNKIPHLKDISTYLMDPSKSIIKNAETSKRHSTLFYALTASDLDDVLGYEGQFTVFAPTNVAFNKLSKITIERLLNPKNKKELKATLSYHIVAGKISASEILRSISRGGGEATFTTVQGEKITASMSGIDIVLTDMNGHKAKIVLADSNQCNGVIHEIDSVFLPIKI